MGKSEFTGSLLGLFGIYCLQALIVSVTAGIATPWAVCMREKWIAEHTVIDGKHMIFDGTGGELFGKYIIWWLLTAVTCGIYGLWLGIKMKQWVVEHTHLVD